MIKKRWQLYAGVLAVLAITLNCSLPLPSGALAVPQSVGSSPTPAPTRVLAVLAPKKPATPAPQIWETVSANKALNIRSGPGVQFSSLGTFSHGKKVFLSGKCSGAWAETVYRGSRAWLHSRYLSGETCKEE